MEEIRSLLIDAERGVARVTVENMSEEEYDAVPEFEGY